MRDLEPLWRLPGMPDYSAFRNWLHSLSHLVQQQLPQRGMVRRFALVLETDIGAAASISDDGSTLSVYLPEGLPLRFVYMARLMLRYYPNTRHVAILDSPFDNYSPDRYFISETLAPALADFPSLSAFGSAFATRWTRWDNGVSWDKELPILLRMAMQHVISHELAHATRGHFKLRSNPRFVADIRALDAALALERPTGLGALTLDRALELDADVIQGKIVASDHIRELASGPGQDPINMALRDAYSLFCLLGIFDAKRRQVANYKGQNHLPPILRYQMIKRSYFRAISPVPELLETMQHADTEGFNRAYRSIQDIHLDCITQQGPFALDPKSPHGAATITPSSTMVGGMVSANRLANMERFIIRETASVMNLIAEQ